MTTKGETMPDTPTGKTYRIESVADFALIPADRRDACLADFRVFLGVSEAARTILGVEGVKVIGEVFDWTDDGKSEITDIVIEGTDGSRLSFREVFDEVHDA